GVGLGQVAGRGLVQAAIGGATFEHEAPVAIAAIDVALLVDLHVDARMAERGRSVVGPTADVAGAVAPDPRSFDHGGFGDVIHRPGDKSEARAWQWPAAVRRGSIVVEGKF